MGVVVVLVQAVVVLVLALVDRLREEIGGMSTDNFLVRPKRKFVERFAKEEPWKALTYDARNELIDEVAGRFLLVVPPPLTSEAAELAELLRLSGIDDTDFGFDLDVPAIVVSGSGATNFIDMLRRLRFSQSFGA